MIVLLRRTTIALLVISTRFRSVLAGNNQKNQQWTYKNTYNQNYFQTSDNGSYKRSSSSNNNFYNGAQEFTVCDDSVVRVRALYAVCDSPYTFYYGNGANRNSPVCDYGDKLSMEVRFEVTDDIRDSDTVFVTLAVSDDAGNVLITVDPVYLCDDLVGYECTNQGYYGFIYRLRLPYPYNDGGQSSTSSSSASGSSSSGSTSFRPNIQMAFSTQADSGYNLGAVNVECEPWDPNDPVYVSWMSHNKAKRSPVGSFSQEYGILVGSCLVLVAVTAFVWHQSTKRQPAVLEQLVYGEFEISPRASAIL
jgi:hypothetical protein